MVQKTELRVQQTRTDIIQSYTMQFIVVKTYILEAQRSLLLNQPERERQKERLETSEPESLKSSIRKLTGTEVLNAHASKLKGFGWFPEPGYQQSYEMAQL